MRVRSILKWVLAAGVLGWVASAGAQAPPAGGQGSAQVGFERKTQLSPQEQLTESQKHIARMESAAGVVRKMLEEARKQRDVVKTLCLNDKLSQIDVAIRTMTERKHDHETAAARHDTD